MSIVQMAWAKNSEGKMVHVDSVKNGLECGCTCPYCGAPVEARHGQKNEHSFAHASGWVDCQHGYETGLHLRAKQILETEKRIRLPSFRLQGCYDNAFIYFISGDQLVKKGKNSHPTDYSISCAKVEAEVHLPDYDIQPDIFIETEKGEKLIVEIFVTHRVDENKLNKIRKAGISAIEIDLSKCDRNLRDEELRIILCESTNNTKWLYNKEKVDFDNWYAIWTNSHNTQKDRFELPHKEDIYPDNAFIPYYLYVVDESNSIKLYHVEINSENDIKRWISYFFRHQKLSVSLDINKNRELADYLINHARAVAQIHGFEDQNNTIPQYCIFFLNQKIKEYAIHRSRRPIRRSRRL